jgi:hypothetical protein
MLLSPKRLITHVYDFPEWENQKGYGLVNSLLLSLYPLLLSFS